MNRNRWHRHTDMTGTNRTEITTTKNIQIPENIHLINIPPYTPELNPSEKVWQFLKERFKNQTFKDINQLKIWLHKTVKTLIVPEKVMSIVHTEFYNNLFKAHFN